MYYCKSLIFLKSCKPLSKKYQALPCWEVKKLACIFDTLNLSIRSYVSRSSPYKQQKYHHWFFKSLGIKSLTLCLFHKPTIKNELPRPAKFSNLFDMVSLIEVTDDTELQQLLA